MRSLLVLFVVASIVSGHEDLGSIGPTYPIKERSIKKEILEGLKNLDVGRIKNEMKRSIEESFTSTIKLQESYEDKNTTKKDFIIAAYDIPDPSMPGRVLYPKGSQIPSVLPKGAKLELCFLDASDDNLTKKIINEFGSCDYMVSNRDVRHIDLLKEYRVYPMNQSYVYRFGIKKIPVKLTMYDDLIEMQTLNVGRLLDEIKKEREYE